jgi:hypothetical protein
MAVHAGSRLYTDLASSYRALQGYVHAFVNHTQKEYASVSRLLHMTFFTELYDSRGQLCCVNPTM